MELLPLPNRRRPKRQRRRRRPRERRSRRTPPGPKSLRLGRETPLRAPASSHRDRSPDYLGNLLRRIGATSPIGGFCCSARQDRYGAKKYTMVSIPIATRATKINAPVTAL